MYGVDLSCRTYMLIDKKDESGTELGDLVMRLREALAMTRGLCLLRDF